ncbi:phasin family protein [Acidovorax sp. NCPPB 4044]|uniref:phasin family protein n=1 Tax=Acidovorax sp. NCPPB 4044 TaxID=2940490 RepID=UPI002302D01D|nr:phasin family protein [Acidovorax sp. NCPPB 4044]MDA8522512.1 phasin family protein [Acidovorax sp. NCPPB 4044]
MIPRPPLDDTPSPADEAGSHASAAARSARDSAQQVWLAGLGAFAKAQQEGSKVFESLVQEGLALQQRTQTTAQQHLAEAASRVGGVASELGARAAGPWRQLESVFEDRVAQALSRLGVPTRQELQALHDRIDALTRALEATQSGHGGPPPSTTAPPSAKSAAD